MAVVRPVLDGHGPGTEAIGLQNYYDRYRTQTSLTGKTPIERAETKGIDFKSYRLQKHCRGLYPKHQLPHEHEFARDTPLCVVDEFHNDICRLIKNLKQSIDLSAHFDADCSGFFS